ncbi:MAG: bifunctional N(6)-L-threonylcarbamoyladenine synthase/serine/threonine protein kinase [Nanoarchaeota archaeon]|nr:bifunctional N(6)-L-threonylcarbamoyladenine synthase/serine/threonine protein kinase [Nanoarchaeota archaeon]MBU1135001.1 bifunctional N(6)-L-threonylcarbamoyladenine synthase/serine/threonine protein kinase [Nanoarchaeota archaeon]MBU2520070.1 bifunctional N(6)-L-threonylcarbamoyladenine synthase/serine/threonine protein kinase [Nanoarchaeota archaeon]
MLSLGIESTAHSFSVGIVDEKGRVLANVIDSYKAPEGWGIEPAKAAQHHREVADKVLEKALSDAKKMMKDIDIISFSQGPGLAPCLHAGFDIAKRIAKSNKKPLYGVNHCVAHIEIGRVSTKAKDPVTLYVSGGNTQILAFVDGRYRCFGESMDIGIGNALDKFGRALGIGFPAGPRIEKEAVGGKYIELPYVVKGMDLSFSGIVTDAIRKKEKGASLKDVSFSLQETLFSMLTEVTERAVAHTGKEEVLLTGGVAANKRLQEMLAIMCKERGAKFYVVPHDLAGDNGSMIAWTGVLMHKNKQKTKEELLPRQRTDEIDVSWL